MKKTTFLALLLIAAALFMSCEKKIRPEARDIFVATYSVTESWVENGKTISKPAFTMSVEKAYQSSDMLLLNNFADYGAGITAEATVSGYFLTIPQQTLPNLKAIIGTGKTDGPTLTFTYIESNNSVSIEITAIAKKK